MSVPLLYLLGEAGLTSDECYSVQYLHSGVAGCFRLYFSQRRVVRLSPARLAKALGLTSLLKEHSESCPEFA